MPDHDALLTDLYQLTMAQAYLEEGRTADATFSLFVRRLPASRNLLLASGVDHALDFLESAAFGPRSIDYLRQLGHFSAEFLAWLSDFRFSGRVHAVAEGTPVFAEEPILEVTAPLPEAQIVETMLIARVHLATMLASKALRVVQAARGRAIVEFGLRRTHGAEAGLAAARSAWIAGAAGTSNVLAGRLYGIPVMGTMAHSYVQSHDDEGDAFRAFASLYPDSTLLIDTYDTLEGARRLVELARELGDRFRVRAVRLDSGDLLELARGVRSILDDGELRHVEIFASGGLDEHEVDRLVRAGAPIDGFGVGTRMGVSADAPSLDMVYKLTEYDGRGRVKLSPGKELLPGRKQVFRDPEDGDTIGQWHERLDGAPLLSVVMQDGRRTRAPEPLSAARERARDAVEALPAAVRALEPADPPWRVRFSERLREAGAAVAREVVA